MNMNGDKSKIIRDAKYISYLENGESAAVMIARDHADEINTKGKWIKASEVNGKKKDGRWIIKSFVIELFPRITNPKYPEHASEEEIKYITWKTATDDIEVQEKKGYKGPKFKIYSRLININEGKFITKKTLWNRKFEKWVREDWMTSNCEWREKKIPLKEKWEYIVAKTEKM